MKAPVIEENIQCFLIYQEFPFIHKNEQSLFHAKHLMHELERTLNLAIDGLEAAKRDAYCCHMMQMPWITSDSSTPPG